MPTRYVDPSGLGPGGFTINGIYDPRTRDFTNINRTVAGFYTELSSVPDGSIHHLDLSGHSSQNWVGISAEDGLGAYAKGGISFENGKLVLYGYGKVKGDDVDWSGSAYGGFQELLLRKLAPGAKITLWGCNAAVGVRNITRAFSALRPDVTAVGGTGFVYGCGTATCKRDNAKPGDIDYFSPGRFDMYRGGQLRRVHRANPFDHSGIPNP
jgi:hypothetical protein